MEGWCPGELTEENSGDMPTLWVIASLFLPRIPCWEAVVERGSVIGAFSSTFSGERVYCLACCFI